MNRFFVKKTPFSVSPAGALVSYLVLGLWTFLILFPLYWIAITAFKEPAEVNNGPFYIPFVDFEPSMHAWRYIFVDEGEGLRNKFINTLGVSTISTFISVALGASAAYALSRFQFRPKVGTVISFIGLMVLAIIAGVRTSSIARLRIQR